MVQFPSAPEFRLAVRQTQRKLLRCSAKFRRLFPGVVRTPAVDGRFVGADESFGFKLSHGVLGPLMNPNSLSARVP